MSRNRKGINNSNYRHGLSDTRIYHIYHGMINRCYDESRETYKDYGARGIKVCDEWLIKKGSQGFLNFYNWALKNGYNDNLSIDRINVDKNYEPNNCRWVNDKVQANNKVSTIYITYKDKTKSLSEWSRFLNIPYDTLHGRLYDHNLSVNEAFTKEYISKKEIQKLCTFNGETHNLYEWSKILNISYETIKQRARKYKDDVEEIFKPVKYTGKVLHEYNNEYLTLKEIAKKYNVTYNSLKYRVYKKKMTIQEALQNIGAITITI